MKRLAFLLFASCAWANDSGIHDGGDGPEPIGGRNGPESVIRMVREHLDISFGKEETSVRATFVFLNTKKDAPARQTVGFPDQAAMFKNGLVDTDFGGPIKDLVTVVNGRKRKSRKLHGWVKWRDGYDDPAKAGEEGASEIFWHAIEVEFPVGKEVKVERRYRVANGGGISVPPDGLDGTWVYTYFEYTTATGGVWKGTIGQMIADVKLIDGLRVDDLSWNAGTYLEEEVKPTRKHWHIQSPTKMQLVWKNFEPRTEREHRDFRIVYKRKLKSDPDSK